MTSPGGRDVVRRIIRAYDDPVVRAYGWIRFGILRQRFLDEIGQYLPASGPVLDIGCGFGLFSLYYAMTAPGRFVRGVDVNARRIALARRAAARLGLGNVAYEVGDARDFKGDVEVTAAYMLDIVHHIPPAAVPPLLRELRRSLAPGGTLVVKDVDARPAAKRWFTWALDKAMAPTTPVHYWTVDDLTALLEATGFRVRRHLMVDVLPYPHVLYACERRADAPERRADATEG
jgi:SAM-dependent methyltransferase